MIGSDGATALTIAVLISMSAFYSAAEIGILSLGRLRLANLVEAGSRSARVLQLLLERPSSLLTGVLVSITAINYAAETVAARWAIDALGEEVGPVVAIAGMTVVVLVFAEVTPISYAAANPERVALLAARVVAATVWVLRPVSWGIAAAARGMVRLVGGPLPPGANGVTEQEIRTIVAMQAERGALEEEEKEMIHSIFEFGDTVAREVMVPRTDMVCVERSAPVGETVNLAVAHGFSRLPVYEGSLDRVVGIVHAKVLLSYVETGRLGVPVAQAMRTPFFVPETKKVSDLLAEFRRRKRSIAIVLDEYGGTAGLLTMEDLLEQIVGEIYDEHDVEHPAFEQRDEHTWVLDGKMNIAEAAELIGLRLPEGDYDTVGGLVYDRLGFVPRVGDRVECEGASLVVEALDRHRIASVRVVVQPQETPEEEDADE